MLTGMITYGLVRGAVYCLGSFLLASQDSDLVVCLCSMLANGSYILNIVGLK